LSLDNCQSITSAKLRNILILPYLNFIMPNIGERWDKVESTEKEVKVLRDDIKKSDRNSRIAIYH